MSKDNKISSLKPFLKDAMKKLTMGNAQVYGGQSARGASPLAGLGSAILMKADQMAKGKMKNGVTNQDWIEMGRKLADSINSHKKGNNKINAVCDTCAGLAIYKLDNLITFKGKVELFAETTIHHHYVVVDRAPGSDKNDYTTWGENAFVIDIWQASSFGGTTKRKWNDTAHHYKHGIYRNPEEHVYTLNKNGKYKYKVDATWLMQ